MAGPIEVDIDQKAIRQFNETLKAVSPAQNRRIYRNLLGQASLETQRRIRKDAIKKRGKAPPIPSFLTNRSGGRGLIGTIAVDRTRFRDGIGRVFTDSPYGAVHERGGRVRFRSARVRAHRVKAHTRKIAGKRQRVPSHFRETFQRKSYSATYPRRRFMGLGLDLAQPKFAGIAINVLNREIARA